MFTPSDLELLLHCHVCGSRPHPRADAPAIKDGIDKLLRCTLIEPYKDYYHTTRRGARLIDMLCDTPLPIQTWSDPR